MRQCIVATCELLDPDLADRTGLLWHTAWALKLTGYGFSLHEPGRLDNGYGRKQHYGPESN